jgi:hypothetical protein
MLNVRRAVALIPILSLAATGQTAISNWDGLKMIAPGTEVRVTAGNSKPVRGKLENVTDNDLVIGPRTGPQSFARPEIRGVSVKKKGHRLRNTLIGMGAGTAAGLGIGGAEASGCKQLLCGLAVPVYGAIGFIAGTVTGLVLPTGGWRQVYAP